MNEKKKPRGKAFTSGEDDRRNCNGQRNAAAIETATQIRALYVQVLAEDAATPTPDPATLSNLERIVRRHVELAMSGDARARETMMDRIWGRALQPMDFASSDGSMTPKAVQFIPYDG